MKKFSVIVLMLCMTLVLASCKSTAKDSESENNKLKVYVSFNALAEFASVVALDKADIHTMVPTGSEPHDFEPKAADIAGLTDANMFIYNGLGMESWAEKSIEAAANNKLKVVITSDNANVILSSDEDHEDGESDEEEDGDEHGKYDPHTWLSIKEAEIAVQHIADSFSEIDPENKEFYQTNASNYIKSLDEIYSEYKEKFDTLDQKYFITGHAAFGYFCRDFGLEQNSVEDVFAEGEPSPQQLTKLIEYCKEKNITTIFAEEMASPEVSETLANEVGAKVQTIYTMESAEDDLSYLERMKDNCERVYQSLAE